MYTLVYSREGQHWLPIGRSWRHPVVLTIQLYFVHLLLRIFCIVMCDKRIVMCRQWVMQCAVLRTVFCALSTGHWKLYCAGWTAHWNFTLLLYGNVTWYHYLSRRLSAVNCPKIHPSSRYANNHTLFYTDFQQTPSPHTFIYYPRVVLVPVVFQSALIHCQFLT